MNFKHGHKRRGKCTREYKSWDAMMSRCYRPNDPAYARYGGRGILVCKQWHNFSNFLSDMGNRPIDCTLDRINVNLGYSPQNCRWADRHTQRVNRRQSRTYQHKEAKGYTMQDNRYRVWISLRGKKKHLGTVATEVEAIRLRQEAIDQICANV